MMTIKLLRAFSLSNLTLVIRSFVDNINYHSGSILTTRNLDFISKRRLIFVKMALKSSFLLDTFLLLVLYSSTTYSRAALNNLIYSGFSHSSSKDNELTIFN